MPSRRSSKCRSSWSGGESAGRLRGRRGAADRRRADHRGAPRPAHYPGGSEGRPLVEAFDTKDANLRGVEVGPRAQPRTPSLARSRQSAHPGLLRRWTGWPIPGTPWTCWTEPSRRRAALESRKSRAAAFPSRPGRRSARPVRGLVPRRQRMGRHPRGARCWRSRSEGLFRLSPTSAGLQLSISGINHDDDLAGVFHRGDRRWAVSLPPPAWPRSSWVAAPTLGPRRPAPGCALALCAALGALAVPASVVALAYWHQGLDMIWRVGDMGRKVRRQRGARAASGRRPSSRRSCRLLGWLSRRGPRSRASSP